MRDPATPSPSDEVVGAMRLPTWTRNVPRASWAVLAVAAVVAWIRLSPLPGTFPPLDPPALVAAVLGAASELLPFGLLAVVLAGPTTGGARRALIRGTGLLAAAELAGLVHAMGPWEQAVGEPGIEPSEPFARSVLGPARAVLHVAGAAFIGVGLARAAAPRVTRPRPLGSTLVLGLGLLASAVNLAVAVALLPSALEAQGLADPFLLTWALFGSLSPVAWAVVVAGAIASRGPAADSLMRLTGASLVFGASMTTAAVSGVSVLAMADETMWPLLWRVVEVALVARALGMVALLVGLATGPAPALRPVAGDTGAGPVQATGAVT